MWLLSLRRGLQVWLEDRLRSPGLPSRGRMEHAAAVKGLT